LHPITIYNEDDILNKTCETTDGIISSHFPKKDQLSIAIIIDEYDKNIHKEIYNDIQYKIDNRFLLLKNNCIEQYKYEIYNRAISHRFINQDMKITIQNASPQKIKEINNIKGSYYHKAEKNDLNNQYFTKIKTEFDELNNTMSQSEIDIFNQQVINLETSNIGINKKYTSLKELINYTNKYAKYHAYLQEYALEDFELELTRNEFIEYSKESYIIESDLNINK
jgi:hypothetical protein